MGTLAPNIVMLLDMLEKACVMAVAAYILVRTDFFAGLLAGPGGLRRHLLLGSVFSCFCLYGATSGLLVNGNLVALIHSGAILAGLVSGPLLGSCVGVTAACLRFSIGGENIVASTIIALLAGVLPGLYHNWQGGFSVKVTEAAALTAGFELCARMTHLLLAASFSNALKAQLSIALPMVLGNVTMVAIFIFVVNRLTEERETRKIKDRLESELLLAREIQLSLVPNHFPPYPDRPEFDIFAVLEPAKEVGGDMYDFFFLDEKRLCFIIGDVSGKGIPAALFMAATRTLFKAEADREMDIALVVERVNRELCRGNEAAMFVTLFCGILATDSGEIVFCNAGHNPPYIVHAQGGIENLTEKHGPALGIVEEARYDYGQIVLAPGDMVVLYTDGVTEAINGKNEMFSASRLETLIQSGESCVPSEVLPLIMEGIRGFANWAEQSDDIALLAITYKKTSA